VSGNQVTAETFPTTRVSRGLLGTAAKLRTMGSSVTETGAQLAANMLLSRPLVAAGVAPILLPIVWLLVCSRLALVLVSVTVAVGTPITSRTTPITAEV
jgi:hypothetical protein